jgi:hypothetical protein
VAQQFGRARVADLASSLLALLTAIIVMMLASVPLLELIPEYSMGYGVFQYGREVVGIDLFGGLFPLLLSLLLLVLMGGRDKSGKLARPPQRGVFWVWLIVLAGSSTLIFSIVGQEIGGVSLGTQGGAAAIVLGGLYGVGHNLARGPKIPTRLEASECYAIGAWGLFISDVIRTFTGLIEAPNGAIVWGGGGTHDLVLWFGFYMALASGVFSVLHAPIQSRIFKVIVGASS